MKNIIMTALLVLAASAVTTSAQADKLSGAWSNGSWTHSGNTALYYITVSEAKDSIRIVDTKNNLKYNLNANTTGVQKVNDKFFAYLSQENPNKANLLSEVGVSSINISDDALNAKLHLTVSYSSVFGNLTAKFELPTTMSVEREACTNYNRETYGSVRVDCMELVVHSAKLTSLTTSLGRTMTNAVGMIVDVATQLYSDTLRAKTYVKN